MDIKVDGICVGYSLMGLMKITGWIWSWPRVLTRMMVTDCIIIPKWLQVWEKIRPVNELSQLSQISWSILIRTITSMQRCCMSEGSNTFEIAMEKHNSKHWVCKVWAMQERSLFQACARIQLRCLPAAKRWKVEHQLTLVDWSWIGAYTWLYYVILLDLCCNFHFVI